MTPVYTKQFNVTLNCGSIPGDWFIGLIRPIYKGKGSKEDPDNYRGITLLSCFTKLFTAALNNRLIKYLEGNGFLGEEHAVFRPGYCTIDHIFTLQTLTELYLKRKKRLYCAFVDYRKAFDTVNIVSLWQKLLSTGINGKVIQVIHNLYREAKSCIKDGPVVSDFFQCNAGVRQGDNLSPLLFSIYLNDLHDYISDHCAGHTSLTEDGTSALEMDCGVYLKLCLLLYADDTVILCESPPDLKKAIDGMYDYCQKWDLTVNEKKRKIMIFSRGKVRQRP